MRRLIVAALAIGLLAGACADAGPDAKEDPKEALLSAWENLAKSEGLEMDLSLDATAESLNALGGAGSPGALADADADKLLNSSVHVITKGQGDDAQFEAVVTVAGEEDVTVKVVEKVFYVQADVDGLMETFEADASQLAGLRQQAAAQGLDFVDPLLDGEWVAVVGGEELAKQFGAAPPDDAEAAQQQFIDDMTQALRDTAEVTNEGEDDEGDRLAVSLPVRDLYTRLSEALQSNPASALPFGAMPPASEVPDESVVLDVWVDGDQVTKVSFDLAQIAELEGETAGERAAIVIDLDEFDGDVEPPDDAVEVQAQELMSLFGAAMTGGGGTGAGTPGMPPGGFDCSQLQGAPPSVIEQFAEECPELQP